MEGFRPSLVEYYSKQNGSSCGYCKSKDGSFTYGLHAHTLTVEDYQDMIDRGWRRCGKYCYKSIMDCSCCPLYTIRCAAKEFKLSRSQKKILKKFNNFLITGTISQSKSSARTEIAQPIDTNYLENDKVQASSNELTNILPSVQTSKTLKTDPLENLSSESEKKKPSEPSKPDAAIKEQPNKKNKCMKAKYLRIERKRQKLQKLGLTEDEVGKKLVEKKKYPVVKTIEDYINDASSKKQVHNLRISLVRSSPRSEEFNNTFGASFELYKKYQKFIHKDRPEKLTPHQYERFLITSPLQFIANLYLLLALFAVLDRPSNQNDLPQIINDIFLAVHIQTVLVNSPEFAKSFKESASLFAKYQKAVHHESDEDCDVRTFKNFLIVTPLEASQGYGSYHQQYWLDNKLIAVGVIDILPKCLSSVYFFYDPEYSHLCLGTYGALREVEFTRKLSNCFPDLVYYYMGLYIHSCVKMKYKGAFKPSFLLCPEIYTWHPIKECISKLDLYKYTRLNDDPLATDPSSSVSEVLILYNRTVMPLAYYLKQKKCDAEEREEILEYARLVGRSCASRMVLFRG